MLPLAAAEADVVCDSVRGYAVVAGYHHDANPRAAAGPYRLRDVFARRVDEGRKSRKSQLTGLHPFWDPSHIVVVGDG